MIPLGLASRRNLVSCRGRCPDVDHLACAGALNRLNQFFMQDPVVSQLVLRHMDDDDSDPKLGKVLLKFKAPVESEKSIKLFLGSRKKAPSPGRPTHDRERWRLGDQRTAA